MQKPMVRKSTGMPDALRDALDRIAVRSGRLPLASEILAQRPAYQPMPAWTPWWRG